MTGDGSTPRAPRPGRRAPQLPATPPREPTRVALVIFDCDGVLVDSERLAVRVEAQLLATLGWPIGEHEIL